MRLFKLKHMLCALLAVTVIFAFSACSDKGGEDGEQDNNPAMSQQNSGSDDSDSDHDGLSANGDDNQTDANAKELEKLLLLKEGDTKSLVGFNLGDPVDLDLVEGTGDFLEGGEIYLLKGDEPNNGVMLFFAGENESFSGLGASTAGNFFGLIVGQDGPEKAYTILGEPDTYEEESDMYGTPMAIYEFENASLYLIMDGDGKIASITYIGK